MQSGKKEITYCCSVCKERLSSANLVPQTTDNAVIKTFVTTKCGHLFHPQCLNKAFASSGNHNVWESQTCPVCQMSLTVATDLIRIFPTTIPAIIEKGPTVAELSERLQNRETQIVELRNLLESAFLRHRETEKTATQLKSENEVLKRNLLENAKVKSETGPIVQSMAMENEQLKSTVISLSNSLARMQSNVPLLMRGPGGMHNNINNMGMPYPVMLQAPPHLFAVPNFRPGAFQQPLYPVPPPRHYYSKFKGNPGQQNQINQNRRDEDSAQFKKFSENFKISAALIPSTPVVDSSIGPINLNTIDLNGDDKGLKDYKTKTNPISRNGNSTQFKQFSEDFKISAALIPSTLPVVDSLMKGLKDDKTTTNAISQNGNLSAKSKESSVTSTSDHTNSNNNSESESDKDDNKQKSGMKNKPLLDPETDEQSDDSENYKKYHCEQCNLGWSASADLLETKQTCRMCQNVILPYGHLK